MAATSFLSAKALDLRTVRVLFGNAGVPATLILPDISGEVFDQLAWSFTPTAGLPAVTPRATSAVEFRSTAPIGEADGVDLTLDIDITPDATYTVSNPVVGADFPAGHTATLIASGLLNFPAAREFSLLDFIPRINVSDDTSGDMTNFVKVLQEPLNLLLKDVDRWIEIFDSDLAPSNFLDLILLDLGNPFHFNVELSDKQKRRLAHALVDIYKLKGTLKGVQEAISLFMGMRSEFVEFNGLGNQLDAGFKLDDATHVATPPFHLGGGGPWLLLVKVGTTVASQTDAGVVSPAAGGPLTAAQVDQVLQILAVMKPAHLVLVPTGSGLVRWGCTLSKRNAIQRVNGTTAKLFMEPVSGADHYAFLESLSRDLQEFSSSPVGPVAAGACLTGTNVVHGGTIKYWNGVAQSTGQPAWVTTGLLGNEITNELSTAAATVLTVTPQSRNLRLSWIAVTGATRYRIYRSASAMVSPVAADNADSPIEVFANQTSYNDPQETGVLRHYIVAPVKKNSEGFFSNDASGTAI